MDEREFCLRLEHRICRELEGFRDPDCGFMWCDGVLLHQLDADSNGPYIDGRLWFGQGGQTEMKLTLRVPAMTTDKKTIDWASLLPADNVTEWLLVDAHRKHVEINLSKARPMNEGN